VWEGDSEALLQAVRFFGDVGGRQRSAAASSSLFWDVGRAIAKRCCKQFAFWGCGSAITKHDLKIIC